ncbi:hypothetical protein CHISP_0951 [Chitinispirillum alkaliphilum]|nr:hypothetical protein CHISP_0951 [Chitinispirillum alkaliphilum]
MEDLKIVNFDESCAEEAAKVYSEAFMSEGVNSYIFDFSRKSTREFFQKMIAAEIMVIHKSGYRIVTVCKDGRVAGVAILKNNRKLAFLKRTQLLLHRLPVLAKMFMKVRLKRAKSVMKAIAVPKSIRGHYSTLYAIAVHPEFQNMGIGKMLLAHVHRENEADPNNCGVYLFTADKKNHALYERVGYKTVETKQGGDLTIYHMFRMSACRNGKK